MDSTESDMAWGRAMLSEFTAFDWPVVAEPLETSEPSTVFEAPKKNGTYVIQVLPQC